MKWFTVFLSLCVLSGHIISASYAALHALHLVQQNAALGQQNQQHSPSLEQNSDSSKLANDLTSTATSSEDYDAHPQYSFAYDVKDSLTGDDKQQEEQRDGDVVQGQYSLIEPDGTRRVVEYTADDANGFNAVVSKQTLTEPQQLLHNSPVAGISSSSQYNSIEVLQSQLQEHSIAEAQAQSAAYAEAQALAEAQVRAEDIAQSKQNEQDKLQLEAQKQLQQKLQHAEEQQQLLRSQLEQSQEHLTNEQALLLSQSLPNKVLGHSVHTTVVSHPPTLLSRSPSGSVFSHTSDISSLKDIHDNAASHLTIERTVHPQIVITQPASATIQASILHSPLTLLDAVANGNGLQSSSFISNRIFNSGHTTSNGNLLLDSNVGHNSEQLSKNLDSNDLHASAVNENGKTNGQGNGNGNSNGISHGIANKIALSNDNGNGISFGTDNDKSLRNGLNQQQPERLQTTYINGNGKTIW